MSELIIVDGFDAERFFTESWQKKPCLIRNWLAPQALELDTLLATADEHELPMRLVSGSVDHEDWAVSHGPLSDSDLPASARDWTVLVQEMDKVDSDVARMLEKFRFLPDWMIDDVMISQAVVGGSVGPHLDAYDVFLVQAAGQRRWQLQYNPDPEPDERFELALIKDWAADTEIVAVPGDVLYLPAGVGHHGVAENDCQTWSVGLRTPSGPELMFYLAESISTEPRGRQRLRPSSSSRDLPEIIDPALVKDARQLLERCLNLDDNEMAALLGRFLTSWRLWPGEESPSLSQVTQQLRAGRRLPLAASARLAIVERNDKLVLIVNGEELACGHEQAINLCRTRKLGRDWLTNRPALEQLIELAAIDQPPRPHIV